MKMLDGEYCIDVRKQPKSARVSALDALKTFGYRFFGDYSVDRYNYICVVGTECYLSETKVDNCYSLKEFFNICYGADIKDYNKDYNKDCEEFHIDLSILSTEKMYDEVHIVSQMLNDMGYKFSGGTCYSDGFIYVKDGEYCYVSRDAFSKLRNSARLTLADLEQMYYDIKGHAFGESLEQPKLTDNHIVVKDLFKYYIVDGNGVDADEVINVIQKLMTTLHIEYEPDVYFGSHVNRWDLVGTMIEGDESCGVSITGRTIVGVLTECIRELNNFYEVLNDV